ncbi:MAG TPA: hypothetical protein ENH15_02535 [Actinobacteria bacterium]|nr:hypothetical protein [Actinomycetota bacterium]
MANPAEIPQIASDLFDLAKRYLDQEAIRPLRSIGRYVGFSLGAGVLLGLGWVMLSIAGLRLASDLLPSGVLWSSLAYVIGAAGAGVVSLGLLKIAATLGRPK